MARKRNSILRPGSIWKTPGAPKAAMALLSMSRRVSNTGVSAGGKVTRGLDGHWMRLTKHKAKKKQLLAGYRLSRRPEQAWGLQSACDELPLLSPTGIYISAYSTRTHGWGFNVTHPTPGLNAAVESSSSEKSQRAARRKKDIPATARSNHGIVNVRPNGGNVCLSKEVPPTPPSALPSAIPLPLGALGHTLPPALLQQKPQVLR